MGYEDHASRKQLEKAQELLGELVGIESHTLEGQDKLMDWLKAYVENVLRVKAYKILYPEGSALADKKPHPSNLMFYIGKKAPDQVKRNTLIYEHGDTVPPHDDYKKFGINPYTLRRMHPEHQYILGGLGAGDMKMSIVSMLMALEGIEGRLHEDQGVTGLVVSREEIYSEGMHAIMDEDRLKHVTEAIPLEIRVGGSIGQDPVLLAGRPGRVELLVSVEGLSSHTGDFDPKRINEYVFRKESKAKDAIWKLRLPEHADDFPNDRFGNMRRTVYLAFQRLMRAPNERKLLMPRGMIVPTKYDGTAPTGMNVANKAWFNADVLYSNPELTPEFIVKGVRRCLKERGIDCEVELVQGRGTPTTPPWREDVPSEGVIQDAYAMMSDMFGGPVEITYGKPTADDGIINRNGRHIPAVGVTPDEEGAHTANEMVDVRTTLDRQKPFIRKMVTRPMLRPHRHTS